MSRELPFLVLCIEEYKNQKGLTGKEVIALFNQHRVFDYIISFYESLHTFGMRYVVDDLDSLIESRQRQNHA